MQVIKFLAITSPVDLKKYIYQIYMKEEKL